MSDGDRWRKPGCRCVWIPSVSRGEMDSFVPGEDRCPVHEEGSEAKKRPGSDLLSGLRITGRPPAEARDIVQVHNAAVDLALAALRSERAVTAVMTAQREHVITAAGARMWNDTTEVTQTDLTASAVVWTSWWCLGCDATFDSQQDADEHPVRMGLAALAGGRD